MFGSGKKENNISRDGISLSFFIDEFVSRCGGMRKIQDMTTAEVCFNFIIPWTKEKRSTYCQFIQEENPDLVRPATVYINHAWKSLFWELIDTLLDHFHKKKLNEVFIWIDILSINQHVDLAFNIDWFNNDLFSIIDAIGNSVVVLSTWKQSLPFQRTWCLTEIYLSLLSKGKFEIIMKDREKSNLIEFLKKNSFNEFLNAFCPSIRLQNSETSNPDDKIVLLQFLECSEGGIMECEAIIQEQILTWLISFIEKLVMESSATAIAAGDSKHSEDSNKNNQEIFQSNSFILQLFLGDLYFYLMNYSQSTEIYQKLVNLLKKRNLLEEKENFQFISIVRKLAVSFQKEGKYQEADIFYHDALSRYRKLLQNQDNVETFNLLNEIIFFYIEQTDYEEAINGYKECIKIAEHLFGTIHIQTITSMNHLGLLYLEQENYEEAEIYFEKTYDILCTNDKEYGKDHAITLETMKNLGITYVGLEKFYDAEQLFVDCFRREEIRLKNLLPNNNNNSNTNNNNNTETTVVGVNPQRRFSNNRLSEGKEPDLSTRESIGVGGESSRKGGRRGSESKLNETKEEANDRISLSEMKEAIDYNESKNEGNNNRNNNKNNNNHPEMIRLSVINILDVLQQLNLIYQEEHRYLEAISINQDYLRIYRQYYSVLFPFYYHSSSSSSQGKDHHHHETDLIKVYQSLGKLYFLQNQFDKCEQIMKECLMKQKQLQLEFFQQQQQQQGQGQGQGQQSKSNLLRNSYNQTTMTSTTNNSYSNQDDDESMLITFELLSDVLEKQGNWMECLQFTKEWMNKIKKVHGGKTYELVTPYERLLAMYKQLNKTEEELALYPEMIDRFKKVFDYEATPLNSARSESISATTATTSNTTAATAASSFHRQQRRQPQQQHQQQQQEDLLPELDNETRYYLKKLNSLMKSYAILLSSDRIQKYEQAEQYYKECFQIEKNRLYGSDHLETMETLYQLAYLTAIQGKYREGEIILKKSLEKSLKLFGENHEFTMKLKKTMNEFHEFRESEEKRNGKCIIS